AVPLPDGSRRSVRAADLAPPAGGPAAADPSGNGRLRSDPDAGHPLRAKRVRWLLGLVPPPLWPVHPAARWRALLDLRRVLPFGAAVAAPADRHCPHVAGGLHARAGPM